MTRLEALRALYAAVKDGKLPEAIFHGASAIRGHWAYVLPFDAEQRRNVYLAYSGSVDAALALIAATLPGWAWDVSSYGEATLWPSNDYATSLPDDDPLWDRLNETDDHPATALLLACIAAHIAIEERGE